MPALTTLAEKFSSPQAIGRTHVTDSYEIDDADQREFIQRDAFEKINHLVGSLGFE